MNVEKHKKRKKQANLKLEKGKTSKLNKQEHIVKDDQERVRKL